MAAPILFHFDYLSPYAYIAWTQIHALAERHRRAVQPVPTLLAALLRHGNTRGPAEIPAKRVWVFKDTLRTARVLGIPFQPPPNHPFNPLLALRASALPVDEGARRRLIDALYQATWGGGGGVETPEQVAAAMRAAGLDPATLLPRAQSEEAKTLLRQATEEAIAAQVFGVPTMRADGELFFGYDGFGHLERFLRGEDPLTTADVARWESTPASAQRREI